MRRPVGPEAGSRQDRAGDVGEVTLALADRLAHLYLGIAGLGEPLPVGRCLTLALVVPVVGPEDPTVDHQPAVRREHHVGQTRYGLDDLDVVPEVEVRLAQLLPLRIASAVSTGTEVSIHALIAYSTVK